MDKKLASYIDHTNLKPDATAKAISQLCQEAVTYGFYSVCVNSSYVSLCRSLLANSPVKVCSVVGFPMGAAMTVAKEAETLAAVGAGADEIDMVINIGALKDGLNDFVEQDIRAVVEAAGKVPVKVIIETCLLSDAEKTLACTLAETAGAAFVKTSTGFASGGATIADVERMAAAVGNRLGVKASGGIRELAFARQLIAAGATRLGTSASVRLVEEDLAGQ